MFSLTESSNYIKANDNRNKPIRWQNIQPMQLEKQLTTHIHNTFDKHREHIVHTPWLPTRGAVILVFGRPNPEFKSIPSVICIFPFTYSKFHLNISRWSLHRGNLRIDRSDIYISPRYRWQRLLSLTNNYAGRIFINSAWWNLLHSQLPCSMATAS